ncbi:uncharacterized protein LOC108044801 [Drosophila rhopaloa]|uniref:MD-2-related lipid-recognition domain-containing protein n=1 Tax=Drosophila rhopaloa TaxID=1041015 RepID=A0ABM5HF25_DRORH|nr:uncharacterized protein LOC108044801 [Drosophila rhopaloa]
MAPYISIYVSLCLISMGINAQEKGHIPKAVCISQELKYDKKFLEYFGFASEQSEMLMINSTQLIKTIFMDNSIVNEDINRTVFNVKNFAICPFLNNRALYKLYSAFYDEFVGNSTVIKCPIKPGVYYLKNCIREVVVPSFHPSGNFRLNVHIRTEKEGSIVMKIIWRYRVMRTKN